MTQIAVLIITHNRSSVLKECIKTVASQNITNAKLTILVADDASTDDTQKTIPQFLDTIALANNSISTQYHRINNNCGVSAARNFLIGKLPKNIDYILFLDDDVYLENSTISFLLNKLTNTIKAGICGPRAVLSSNTKESVQWAIIVSRWSGRYSIIDSTSTVECDAVDPLCLLVKREVLELIGGFPEEFYRSHEGIDFCLRARNHGYKVLYVPETTVRHDTIPKHPEGERVYYLYRNKLLVFHRNFTILQKISALGVAAFVGTPKYIALEIYKNRSIRPKAITIILKAIVDGIFYVTGKIKK